MHDQERRPSAQPSTQPFMQPSTPPPAPIPPYVPDTPTPSQPDDVPPPIGEPAREHPVMLQRGLLGSSVMVGVSENATPLQRSL